MNESRKKIIQSMVRDKVRLMVEDDNYTLTVKKEEREVLLEMTLLPGEVEILQLKIQYLHEDQVRLKDKIKDMEDLLN